MPLLVLLAACAGTGGDTAAAADTAAAGSGTISGAFDGRTFETVGAAWRAGKPDDPAQTMVIYVFDNPISCADIVDVAWDETVTDQTQSIEMKLVGLTKGNYPQASRTPRAGESDTNYTLTSTSGTPSETGASGGSVTIDAADSDSATGSFDLTFPSGDTLAGTFSAAPCADGREP